MPNNNQDFASLLGITPSTSLGNVDLINSFLNDEEPEETAAAPEDKTTPKVKEESDKTPDEVVKPIPKQLKGDDLLSLLEEEPEKEKEEDDEPEVVPVEEGGEEEGNEDKPVTVEATPYENLSKDLLELGVFSQIEGEEIPKTPEEFLAKFNSEKEKGMLEYISQFTSKNGAKHGELFDALFIKNIDPREVFPTYVELLNLADVDMKDEDSQIQVLYEGYRRKGWTEDKISKRVEKLREYGDLEEEAQVEYEQLIANDKKELEKKAKEAEKQEQLRQEQSEAFKSSVKSLLDDKVKAKDFDGIPITQKEAKDVMGFLTDIRWKLPSGKLLTDFDKFLLDLEKPESAALKAKIALLKLNNFDTSKIKRTAVTQESNHIFKNSVSNKSEVKKSNTTPKKSTASSNLFANWATTL